ACQAEYSNPLDRRFHAQPIACADCGPTINFVLNDGSQHCKGENALIKAVDALKSGQIIAVKGIGGYHICCDATNDYAVLELRRRKKRSDKPLAVLFPSLGDDEVECLNDFVNLTIAQQILVQHPQRPIVIMDQPVKGLSQYITPTLQGVGAMLPYSPLHYLLLDQLKLPIVATSANISGEPVMTDNDEVEQRLSGIVDGFLHHNRPIHRPADDSVYRIVNHKAYPIRLGRGISPLELRLPFQFEQPCLAVGAFTKNTIALGWDDRMVVSPHIGDLESLKSQDVFEKVIDDLQSLYRVQPEIVLCDAHLSYPNSRWAKKQGISVNTIFHHFAHASALYGEHRHQGDLIVFAWDGVGLGVDGTLWGGETLVGQPATWQHTGQLRQFKLPGNDKVARQPWRSAVSIGWELDLDVMPMTAEISLLKQAWVKNINSPVTSAVGRLFDAASCLIGLGDNVSFEGQGPMQLESICQQGSQWIDLPITHTQDIEEIDWAPLVDMLLDDSKSQEYRSMMFHNSLVRSLLALAIRMRERFGISDVGLTGGVFQNKRLVENAVELLKINGFNVLLASKIPCNDAGISFGQLMEWGAKHGQ
ncbi:MAG: carbamoyltransferase HypF, partial [Methylococcales bacterium]|nr:carbamoyltransferase HypF [Methylococcales bacterium]